MPNYRDFQQESLKGGIDDHTSEVSLDKDVGPRALNVEFHADAVASTSGALKWNNQVIPTSGIRTRVDKAHSPLFTAAAPLGGTASGACSVPLVGYLYFPYVEDLDIGGRFVSEGDYLLGTETFHIRRGRSFEFRRAFEIPIEEKLYEAETRGANAPAVGAESVGFNPPHGFDEALDECIILAQKGGDRAPMSWALAAVNMGKCVGVTAANANRPSNYALVFLWLDVAEWGHHSPAVMKYNLTSGQHPTSGGASAFSTQGYRAIFINKWLRPGSKYNVAVQLKMDSGSPGTTAGAGTNTSWNADGYFKVLVSEDHAIPDIYSYTDSTATFSGMQVIRGPSDSARYLSRYGIRYAGRDPHFIGMGQRFNPWRTCGFIPLGMDAAPLGNGGFSIVDRSAVTAANLYGVGAYTLTCKHTSGDAFVTIENGAGTPALGLTTNNTNGGACPWGPSTTQWKGPGDGAGTIYNTEALNGYRLVVTNDFTAGAMKGGVMNALVYSESGGNARLTITNGATAANFTTWAATPVLVQCFRWHQRDLINGEFAIASKPIEYETGDDLLDARRQTNLKYTIKLDDLTDPDVGLWQAVWPLDDAEGTTVRELVVGGLRNGYMAPFGIGTSEIGDQTALFLSGEGEAVTLDLSGDSVFAREFRNNLASGSMGLACEMTFVPTEAFYAQDEAITLPDRTTGGTTVSGVRPRFVPDLISWDIKDSTTAGTRTQAKPLIALTHRAALQSSGVPFTKPFGFGVEIGHVSDQTPIDPITVPDLWPFFTDATTANINRYDYNAPWVGKVVTIQVGIQPTSTEDVYDVYIALHPKEAFKPEAGDPGDSEFAYWTKGGGSYSATYSTYFTAAHVTIAKKDLVRSVITFGGRWNCKPSGFTNGLGVHELNARMLLMQARVFGTAAPGALPTNNGGITSRNGKLEGLQALPQRVLDSGDILLPVGKGLRNATVQSGSTTVTPTTQTSFFTSAAKDTIDAVAGTYLVVSGDKTPLLSLETLGREQAEAYYVPSVASGGTSLTLSTPYKNATRKNAAAGSVRLFGYTAFKDDIRDTLLTIGRGDSYNPTSTTVANVLLTDVLWENKAPFGDGWRLRIYSPLGRSSVAEILPEWTRSPLWPRRGGDDGVLGIFSHNEVTYAAARGVLCEADDRWRTDGLVWPVGLAFRAYTSSQDVLVPTAEDRLEFASAGSAAIVTSSSDSYNLVIDVRGKLDTIGEYQTAMWVGEPNDDPTANASSASGGNRIAYIVRFARGRPELAIGSTASYTGTTKPEKGLFIAQGAGTVQPGEEFHVRWYLATRASGTILKVPYLKINGRKSAVTVKTKDNNASITAATDWLMVTGLIGGAVGSAAATNAMSSSAKIILGAAHDSYKTPTASVTFVNGSVQGDYLSPQRVQGFVHGLSGTIYECVISRQNTFSTTDPDDFSPYDVSYEVDDGVQMLMFQCLGESAEGVGHKVFDSGAGQRGVIRSNPFISLWHELGKTNNMASFAEFGSQVYCTTGSLPAVVANGKGLRAGIPAPTTAPTFSVQRFPLWKPNQRSKTADSTVNDPIDAAAAGASQQINHYQGVGNSYWNQSLGNAADGSALAWDAGDYFGFKAYIKPVSVTGRVNLWRKGTPTSQGGPFIEWRDGVLYFGWYDTYLKEEVSVRTTRAVFFPGEWHYVYVRKAWPQNDGSQGNWVNSHWTSGLIRRSAITGGTGTAAPPGTSITVGAATGRVIYMPPDLSFIEYIKTNPAAEIPAGALTWTGGSGTAAASTRPMHDIAIVRRMRTSNLDIAHQSPLDMHYGRVVEFTGLGAGSFAAGDTLTDASTNVAKVLWAHPAAAGVQNCCIYFTAGGPTFSFNVTNGTSTATGNTAAPALFRNHVSLTTEFYEVQNAGATGLVTPMGCMQNGYTGAAAGIVNSVIDVDTATAGTQAFPVFTPDMVGMYWVWGSVGGGTASQRGKLYRIASVNSAGTQIRCVVEGTTATTESFAGFVVCEGGVFTGVALAKSSTFDQSKFPDTGTYDVEAFGSSVQGDAISGITPFNGEWATPGWVQVAASTGEDARVFENTDTSRATGAAGADPISVGTDACEFPIFAKYGEPGELRYDDSKVFYTTDAQTYAAAGGNASTQPSGPTLNVPRDTSPVTTATDSANPVFTYTQGADSWTGKRYFAVAFYDSRQDAVSNPSPLLTVEPNTEDVVNRAAAVRYVVKDLPVARGGTSITVRIYASLAGGASTELFQVAEVENGSSQAEVFLREDEIGVGDPLAFNAFEPPRCELVEGSAARMWYAALESDPTAIIASKLAEPVSIDYDTGTGRFTAGAGAKVTALRDLDAQLVAFKRQATATVTHVGTGVNVFALSTGLGARSHQSVRAQDGYLVFDNDLGLCIASRTAGVSLASAKNVSERLRTFFTTVVDPVKGLRSSAAVNRLSNEYVLVTRDVDGRAVWASMQQYEGGDGLRFSRGNGMNVTTIASVQQKGGGIDRLVGGTEEGFLLWLRDDRTTLAGMGEDPAAWGFSTVEASSTTSTTAVQLLGTDRADLQLEGPRGVPVRFLDDDGVERRVTAYTTYGDVLLFSDAAVDAVPASASMTVGAQEFLYETGWVAMGNPFIRKQLFQVQFVFRKEAQGELLLEFFTDLNRTDRVGNAYLVDLSSVGADTRGKVDISPSIEGNWFKARISSPDVTAGQRFELSAIIWRVVDGDQN